MSEAIQRAVKYMFEEQNLHRIMANYMPSNTRSAKLLQNLEFIIYNGQANQKIRNFALYNLENIAEIFQSLDLKNQL